MARKPDVYEWEIPDSWGTATARKLRRAAGGERAPRVPSRDAPGCPAARLPGCPSRPRVFPEAGSGVYTQGTGRPRCAGTRSRSSTALHT